MGKNVHEILQLLLTGKFTKLRDTHCLYTGLAGTKSVARLFQDLLEKVTWLPRRY